MSSFLHDLKLPWLFLALGCAASVAAAQPVFVEGHLRLVSPREVELADGAAPSITAESYAEFPLIILSRDAKKEVGRVTADKDGHYRTALPPGEYLLDVQGRARGRVRAKPRRFTIVSKQTARVDMDVDTGVR
jgi:hypothetical protein